MDAGIMKHLIIFAIVAAILCSCSPRITNNVVFSKEELKTIDEVLVIDYGVAPADAQLLGTIKVGDTGFSTKNRGSYERVITIVKEQARKSGGNIVHITSHRNPGGFSRIHRITADIYYKDGLSVLHPAPADAPDHPDYASIFLYRTDGNTGSHTDYIVYLNNTGVYRCFKSSSAEIRVPDARDVTIWAKKRTRAEVSFKVEPGKDYYVNCSVIPGTITNNPAFQVVDALIAKDQFLFTDYNTIVTLGKQK